MIKYLPYPLSPPKPPYPSSLPLPMWPLLCPHLSLPNVNPWLLLLLDKILSLAPLTLIFPHFSLPFNPLTFHLLSPSLSLLNLPVFNIHRRLQPCPSILPSRWCHSISPPLSIRQLPFLLSRCLSMSNFQIPTIFYGRTNYLTISLPFIWKASSTARLLHLVFLMLAKLR